MKKIKRVFLSVIKFIPKIMPDALAVMGALFISYGAFLFIKPLGLIVLGIMFILSAVILSKAR